jgi:hypothetical protein
MRLGSGAGYELSAFIPLKGSWGAAAARADGQPSSIRSTPVGKGKLTDSLRHATRSDSIRLAN